jgi:hypothetical protein
MKAGTKIVVLLAAMLLGLPQHSARREAFAQSAPSGLQFKFTPGQPLTYAMSTRMKIDMDMRVGGESAKTKVDFTLRCNVKLTPKAQPKAGITTCGLSTSDIEGDWDIGGPAGNIVLKLRGSRMTGTQNGNVIIDTEKDIGTAQAKEFRKEIAALYMSGEMDLDSRGNIKDIRGEMAFVDFWREANEGSVGFFGIVFPEKPVPQGSSWTEIVSLKKMGDIQLEGEGLRCTVTFTRQPDSTLQGTPLALFKTSAPFDEKNLVGNLLQMGQKTRLSIPTFRRKAAGTAQFDPQKGLLLDSDLKIDADASMNAVVQGQQLNMDMTIQAGIALKSVPAAAAKPGPVKPAPPPLGTPAAP